MKERNIILGCDFEKSRKKVKKDKNYLASLNNKEQDETVVEKEVIPAPAKEENTLLPFGRSSF